MNIKEGQPAQQSLDNPSARNNFYALPAVPNRREASSAFASNVARFNQKMISETPGPGTYQPINQWNSTKHSAPQEILPRSHLWLLENQRFQLMKSPTNAIGPGSYNIRSQLSKNPFVGRFSQGERWSGRERSASEGLGPGSYNYSSSILNDRHSPTQRSQAKSYLSSIIPSKHPLTNPMGLNNKKRVQAVPGPGHYDPNTIEKSKHHGNSFDSKVPRFIDRADLEVSPGMYEVEGDFERLLRKIHSPHSPIVKTAKNPLIKVVKSIDLPQPGPGSYNPAPSIQDEVLKKYVHGYKGDFGSHEERFKSTKYHRSIVRFDPIQPGPGFYMKPQKSIEHDERMRQLKNSPEFLSGSSRISPEQKAKQDVPFGGYNLRLFDISYRANKKREHLQKLKRIDIDIPAFQSKAKR